MALLTNQTAVPEFIVSLHQHQPVHLNVTDVTGHTHAEIFLRRCNFSATAFLELVLVYQR